MSTPANLVVASSGRASGGERRAAAEVAPTGARRPGGIAVGEGGGWEVVPAQHTMIALDSGASRRSQTSQRGAEGGEDRDRRRAQGAGRLAGRSAAAAAGAESASTAASGQGAQAIRAATSAPATNIRGENGGGPGVGRAGQCSGVESRKGRGRDSRAVPGPGSRGARAWRPAFAHSARPRSAAGASATSARREVCHEGSVSPRCRARHAGSVSPGAVVPGRPEPGFRPGNTHGSGQDPRARKCPPRKRRFPFRIRNQGIK